MEVDRTGFAVPNQVSESIVRVGIASQHPIAQPGERRERAVARRGLDENVEIRDQPHAVVGVRSIEEGRGSLEQERTDRRTIESRGHLERLAAQGGVAPAVQAMDHRKVLADVRRRQGRGGGRLERRVERRRQPMVVRERDQGLPRRVRPPEQGARRRGRTAAQNLGQEVERPLPPAHAHSPRTSSTLRPSDGEASR